MHRESLLEQLQAEGVKVHFDEDITNVDSMADIFVFTPAVPASHPAFTMVKSMGKSWHKRSEVLEAITASYPTLAVAGTHGKTTTTAFLAHLMNLAHGNISSFVGGVMVNYNSNLIVSNHAEFMVAEADEYDRSFLKLNPKIAVITSTDADHLDIYGTHEELRSDFQKFAIKSAKVILHQSIFDGIEHGNKLSYGDSDSSDYSFRNLRVEDGQFVFQVTAHGKDLGQFQSQMAGRHNVENALAAIAVCNELGLDTERLRIAVNSFQGVQRRFERVLTLGDNVLIDDYAHHPKEIEAAISAARELFPNRKLTVVFQPHLFTRTRDLEDGFVESLNKADEVILLPIYPAREEPILGVSSANLLSRLSLKTKLLVEKSNLVNAVLSLSPDHVLMLGAGDIDRLVKPVAIALKNRWNAN